MHYNPNSELCHKIRYGVPVLRLRQKLKEASLGYIVRHCPSTVFSNKTLLPPSALQPPLIITTKSERSRSEKVPSPRSTPDANLFAQLGCPAKHQHVELTLLDFL